MHEAIRKRLSVLLSSQYWYHHKKWESLLIASIPSSNVIGNGSEGGGMAEESGPSCSWSPSSWTNVVRIVHILRGRLIEGPVGGGVVTSRTGWVWR